MICRKCKIDKDPKAFYNSQIKRWCKVCMSKYQRERKQEILDRINSEIKENGIDVHEHLKKIQEKEDEAIRIASSYQYKRPLALTKAVVSLISLTMDLQTQSK